MLSTTFCLWEVYFSRPPHRPPTRREKGHLSWDRPAGRLWGMKLGPVHGRYSTDLILSWDRPGPTLRGETAAGARHVFHGPHPELGPARRPTLGDETSAYARPPFHGPHPELVEGRVWDPAPVLGIGRGSQSTSFDRLRMRVVDGGTEFFKLNALANCFFLACRRMGLGSGPGSWHRRQFPTRPSTSSG